MDCNFFPSVLRLQWRLLSSSGVKGSRGSSWPSARLQLGQGMPAPPHTQACGPCQGLSGGFSQTQPQSSQRGQLVMNLEPSDEQPDLGAPLL
jgi:hypothetical protein